MKAVVLHEYGGPEKLKYEDWRDPEGGDDKVIVQVLSAGVNPIDWKIRSGVMKDYMPLELPDILGYDYAGVVQSVGKAVTGYAEGDKVFGRTGKTYAQYLLADLAGMAKIPVGMGPAEAAALPVILNTGEQLIRDAGKVKAGQKVLITGALGAVGRTAVWVARKDGAHVTIGVRGSQKEAAEELGADAILALDSQEEMNSFGPVDVVADTLGGTVGNVLLAKVAQGGTFASVVGPPADAQRYPNIRVEAFGSHADAEGMRVLAEDIVKGKFRIPISRRYPLAEAARAHAETEKGGVGGKVLLLT